MKVSYYTCDICGEKMKYATRFFSRTSCIRIGRMLFGIKNEQKYEICQKCLSEIDKLIRSMKPGIELKEQKG
jgi:transcription initiation factor IIE alpha subunit